MRKIAKEINFKNVTANQYKEELIRDSFINGIESSSIRQRLLENNDLTLDQAINQAKSLDEAHKNANSYNKNKDFSPVAAATN